MNSYALRSMDITSMAVTTLLGDGNVGGNQAFPTTRLLPPRFLAWLDSSTVLVTEAWGQLVAQGPLWAASIVRLYSLSRRRFFAVGYWVKCEP